MVQTVVSAVDIDRRRVRFNPLLVCSGAILIALLTVASQVERGGTLGSFEPDTTFADRTGERWKPPLWHFIRTGCCVDDIRSARWNGTTLTIHAVTQDFDLPLCVGTTLTQRPVPGGPDVLSVAYSGTRLWVPESQHNRLLEIDADGDRRSLVGSSVVGPVKAVAVLNASPIELLLTTGSRPLNEEFQMQQAPPQTSPTKLYLNRTASSPAVLLSVKPDQPSAVTRLDIGDDLMSPTGLALSTGNQFAYVVDERVAELAWLKLIHQGDTWHSQGKLVRFVLEPEERGLFRGLVVMQWRGQDLLIGSGPRGLEFYSVNGEHLGTVRTDEQISVVLAGEKVKEKVIHKVLYVVAGKTVWESILQP